MTLHYIAGGGGGVGQKVTKGDRGEGGSGLFSKALMTSFLDGPNM